MSAAFADSAVGHHVAAGSDSFRFVKLLEGAQSLERAVFIGRLRPRNINGSGNVTGALRSLGESWRSNDLSREFVNGADVDQFGIFFIFDHRQHILLAGTDGLIRIAGTVN